MRIVRITERSLPVPGGKEVHVTELSRTQAARGHDVRMYIRFGSTEQDGVSIERLVTRPPFQATTGLVGTVAFMRQVTHALPRSPTPDLVHLHGDLVEAYFGSRAAHKLGVPCVLTVHGGLNPRLTKISKRAFARVDQFIAVADNVASDLARCSVRPERIAVISSGLNWDLLQPWIGKSHPAAKVQVVSVGALDRVKGHDVTIEAVKSLHRSHPHAGLSIIGEGPEHSVLEAQTGGDPRIKFLASRTREEIYELLSKATVFVLSSRSLLRKREGTPTALLEAMALGLPVIVTASANSSGVVVNNENGLVLSADDPEALAKALLHVIEDKDQRERLGLAASRSVQSRGWDETARRIESVYTLARESFERVNH